jgi:hypothetical protein
MKFTSYRDKDLFDTRHGGCFDRGSADSYYNRPIEPHYYENGTGTSEKVTELTEKEVGEYMSGYFWNEQFGDKKSWD